MLKSLSAFTGAFLLSGAALAGGTSISLSDHDIETLEGVDALQRSIVVAGEDACTADYRSESLYGPHGVRNCVVSTVDSAVYGSQVAPLIALHDALPAEERYDADRPTPSVELRELAALGD